MQRFFVIEVDTEYYGAFVREVKQEITGNGRIEYSHDTGAEFLISGHIGPKFYGKLDVFLVDADKLSKAEPITPEPIADDPHASDCAYWCQEPCDCVMSRREL